MSKPKCYIGYGELISYLREQKNWSYRGFLVTCHDIIVISPPFLDNWSRIDDVWAKRFLKEVKVLDLNTFTALEKKVKSERSGNGLKMYWQEVIEERKRNLVKQKQEGEEKENIIQSITLICLVKGNIPMNAFAVDIDSSKLISHLKKAIKAEKMPEFDNFPADKLKLWKVGIRDDCDDQLSNLSLKNQNKLLATKKISKYFPTTPAKEHIHIIVSLNDANTDSSFTELWKKQSQILEQNKDKLVYRQAVNDALLVASAYENLVAGNIMPFVRLLKTFLQTRSKMSLYSANEPVLQAIVESLLPLKYRVPELSLVMDGKRTKGSGRFGYSDIFVLKGTGNNHNITLELKYISLAGLVKNQKNVSVNDLKELDKILEKEDEEFLLKRPYKYWSKEHQQTNWTTIGKVLDSGVDQLRSYMNTISKGKPIDYSSSGVFDNRVRITKSDHPNKLKGFVILVIGFCRILWRPAEDVISNYKYNNA